MKLSEHFSLNELIFSSTAERLAIDNTPPEYIVKRLIGVSVGLEQVRELLGYPIHIDSGYRCEKLNTAVGGEKQSAHMEGWAVDFICPKFGTPLEIVKAIEASDVQFDKCIQEGRWVHISFMPYSRRVVLTAHFGADGVTYTPGV